MEVYLQECKPNLKNSNDSSKIQVVLGNESCDLDSAVSSIVLAYFFYKTHKSADIIIPVLNVKRKDLAVRTEVVFFLQETSISLDHLICVDEIDLKSLHDKGNLDLVLVDHNSLSNDQSYLEPSISQIIDHHALSDEEITNKYETNIEAVGSCCTLVTEEILKTNVSVMDPQIAMLLFGAIILDTVCLSESAKRVTEKDKAMVARLEEFLDGISKEEVFQMLQRVKFDTSKLTPDQLLIKDTKYISENSTSIAIASMPMLLQDIIQSDTFITALEQFYKSKNLTSVILMGCRVPESSTGANTLERQIAVYDPSSESLEKISNYLLKLENPSMGLQPLPVSLKTLVLFKQENFALTRKFVFPAMQNYLKNSKSVTKENETHNSYMNGDKNENSVFPDKEEEYRAPLYRAETLDFPNSPNHSRLLDISVHLQNLTPNPSPRPGIPPPDELNLSSGDRFGTLKRIAVSPAILMSELNEDNSGDYDKDEREDLRSLSSMSNRSEVFSLSQDIVLDDDAETVDDLDDDHSDYLESPVGSEPIPEMSAAEEFAEDRSWRLCSVGGEEKRIDMKVIEPYRKVLSHGGYEGDSHNAIIVFSACYLPDRSRKDYDYVMDNLFLYVIVTLDELVAEDYVLVYLHGATERSAMPSFMWLKRCYQMIDRRLRKNLKGLYLVHPTFWLKTIVIMTRPFISSKFSRKLKFVYTLRELSSIVSLDHVCIPEKVKHFDDYIFNDD